MARMRTIKPEALTSMSLAKVGRAVRWTFAGLWTHCDDDGRAVYEPRLLKAAIYPLDDDVTHEVMAAELRELELVGAVCFYSVAGRSYLHVPAWHDHQHPNRKVDSKLPQCPKTEHVHDAENSTDVQLTEVAVSQPGALTPVVVVVGEGRGDVDGGGVVAETADAKSTDLEPPDTAQTIIGRWIDHCRARPPQTVIGQVSKSVKALLAEGIDARHVEHGLAEWARKGIHPSTLPSVVNEVMNAPPTLRRATTDRRALEGLEVAAQLRAGGE